MKVIASVLPESAKNAIRTMLFGKTIDEVSIVAEMLKGRKGNQHVLLDVGAHWGSSLIPFAQNKWKVFAFEPDPKNRAILEQTAQKYSNVQIETRAVSEKSGEVLPFFTSEVSSGISGLSSFHESHHSTGEVTTIRLDDFCIENQIAKVDFLKIDTEGFDFMVLKSFGWDSQSHPEFIVAEFENRKTEPLGYQLSDMVSFLKDKGYQVVISEWKPIEEYGKRHTWLTFKWDAHEVTDQLAWGNIIACKVANVEELKAAIRKV